MTLEEFRNLPEGSAKYQEVFIHICAQWEIIRDNMKKILYMHKKRSIGVGESFGKGPVGYVLNDLVISIMQKM